MAKSAEKKFKPRVQVNGKAGSGKTINRSGLAKADQQLRNRYIEPKPPLSKKTRKKGKKK